MVNAEQIATFQACFGQAPINVADRRCLNARHKAAGCTRCVDACPTTAIALETGLPQVDDAQCVRCGVCLQVCPTDVFTQHKTPESILRQTVAQLPPRPIGLTCPLHPQPDKSTLPVAAVVHHGCCLAALSVEDLLFLSQRGDRPLWLDDGICVRCPLGHTQTVLQQTVQTANRLLTAFGRSSAIHLHSLETNSLSVEPVQRPVLDGMQPRFSRRGLFTSLRRASQERVAAAAEEEIELAPVRSTGRDERLAQGLPRSRRKLLASLAEADADKADWMETVDTEGMSFATLHIDVDRCSACGLCARFCPTGALTFAQNGERYQLDFQVSACIDCGICTVACPEDVVVAENCARTSSLAALTSQPLAGGKLVACSECGAPTAANSDDETDASLCTACRQGSGTVRPLQDNAGLMADLLTRLPSNSPG